MGRERQQGSIPPPEGCGDPPETADTQPGCSLGVAQAALQQAAACWQRQTPRPIAGRRGSRLPTVVAPAGGCHRPPARQPNAAVAVLQRLACSNRQPSISTAGHCLVFGLQTAKRCCPASDFAPPIPAPISQLHTHLHGASRPPEIVPRPGGSLQPTAAAASCARMASRDQQVADGPCSRLLPAMHCVWCR